MTILIIIMKLLIITTTLLLPLLRVVWAEQEFLDEPESVTVREGEEVVLDCVVQGKAGTLQWTRDDFGLGTARDLAGYNRWEQIGVALRALSLRKYFP